MQARIKFNKKLIEKLPSLQKEATFTGNLVLYRRTTAILLLNSFMTHQAIALYLGVCREVIGRWQALFLAKGPSGLRPKKSLGRQCKLTKSQKKELKAQIQKGPTSCGYKGGVWTSSMVQEYIQKKFGVLYSAKYIPEFLRNMGLSHIKPKYTYSLSREQLKAQMVWVRETLPSLYERVKKEDGVLLFQDESTFQLQANLMATWAEKGNPPTEERNPKRGCVKIFGTIELFTGKLIYSIQDKRLVSGVFAQFLRQVATSYRGRKVFIVMDGATYHGGDKVRAFLEKNPNIHLHKQPAKSPNLNPIEKLWKELKKDRTHNVYFKNKAALKSALRKGLFTLQDNPQRVRNLMKKWEKVVTNPTIAFSGEYDSSLIPKKYIDSIEEISKEVFAELEETMQSQSVSV